MGTDSCSAKSYCNHTSEQRLESQGERLRGKRIFVRVPFRDAVRTARRFSNGACPGERYALHMSRGRTYGVALVLVVLAATCAFQPGLRHYVWPAIAWSIFIMSAMIALAVVGNIVAVLYQMLVAYSAEEEWRCKKSSADLREKMPSFEPRSRPDKHGRVA
jgi:hypothetical protein